MSIDYNVCICMITYMFMYILKIIKDNMLKAEKPKVHKQKQSSI